MERKNSNIQTPNKCFHRNTIVLLSTWLDRPPDLTNVLPSHLSRPRHDSRVTSIVPRGTLLVISVSRFLLPRLGGMGGGGGEVGKNVNCATTMGSILSFVTAVRCPLGLVLNIDIERAGADRDRSMTNRGGFEEWPAPRCFFFFSFFYFPSWQVSRWGEGGGGCVRDKRDPLLQTFIFPFDHPPLLYIAWNEYNPTLSSKFSIEQVVQINKQTLCSRLHPADRDRSFLKFKIPRIA